MSLRFLISSMPQTTPPAPTPRAQTEERSPAFTGEAPSEPAARLEWQWKEITKSLRHVGTKFKLGALLNVCKEREVEDGTIILKFAHRSNMERMQQELENPECRRAFNEALTTAMNDSYQVKLTVVNGGNGSTNSNISQKSHLVRVARSMGARVLDEKEEQET